MAEPGHKVIVVNDIEVDIDPSTYRQIEANAIQIAQLSKFTNTTPPEDNKTENNEPLQYENYVTHEIKDFNSAKLNTIKELANCKVNNDVVIATYNFTGITKNGNEPLIFQQAYVRCTFKGDTERSIYIAHRLAQVDTVDNTKYVWGPWQKGAAINSSGSGGGGGTLVQDNPPSGDTIEQTLPEGGMWYKPLALKNT